MMNEYWIVTDNRTGKIICNCGDINDAIMMVSFDSSNRSYKRNRFLQDLVIDVYSSIDKQLPGQLGLPQGDIKRLQENKIELPEGQQIPVKVT